jgi:hypothetical protein
VSPAHQLLPDPPHSRLLRSMVGFYLLTMAGGMFLLYALTPITHQTTHPAEIADSKISAR